MFERGEEEGEEMIKWVQESVSRWERPLMTECLPGDVFPVVETLVSRIESMGFTERIVRREEILTPAKRFRCSTLQFDMGKPYVSLDPASYGRIGFLVGYCRANGHAAFVQKKEFPGSCGFGGFLTHPVGVLTIIDWLVPFSLEEVQDLGE
jgi:hypothetical protein